MKIITLLILTKFSLLREHNFTIVKAFTVANLGLLNYKASSPNVPPSLTIPILICVSWKSCNLVFVGEIVSSYFLLYTSTYPERTI